MPYMIRVITKQLQLIEIEIGDYRIAKNQGYRPQYPEVYYACLAHSYQQLSGALKILKQVNKIGNVHVH